MKSAAVVALALLESAQAFQAPALKAARSVSKVSMFSEGDIGVLPPLGVYDPLGLCLLYTSPSPRDRTRSRMPSSA